jgi:hypothetical protein
MIWIGCELMISFKNNIKQSTLSFKVIVICLLLSGSLVSPGFANGAPCYVLVGTVLTNDGTCTGAIVIDDTVTSIGVDAFRDNLALTSVIIGNSVTTIGVDAFYNTALTSVTIPDSVTGIGNLAFSVNTALTSVIIGYSVTNIGVDAFSHNPALTSVRFLGNAPAVGTNGFLDVASGATANVAYNATGYSASGEVWNHLIVVYDSAPAGDSGSDSSPTTKTITPVVVKNADSITNMKNKTYLSKYSMKLKLRENNLFEYSASDSFKYQVFKSSKKSCGMRGNYVMRYENSKTCDLYITRTNARGISNKYWVKINYPN